MPYSLNITEIFQLLLILTLASHRLWFLWLTQEIFRPIRERLQERGGWIGYLAGCQVCTSVWISAFIVSISTFGGIVGSLLIWILAISNTVSILNTLNQILERKR